jgi:hypothetical protein
MGGALADREDICFCLGWVLWKVPKEGDDGDGEGVEDDRTRLEERERRRLVACVRIVLVSLWVVCYMLCRAVS